MKDVNILTSNGVNIKGSLELFGDMQMYDETLNDFLEMVNEKLSNLERFKAVNDMQNYAVEVHALKSDARYLGFTTLGDLAYDGELKSKAGDINGVDAVHPKILNEANKMINIAKVYLGLIPPLDTNNVDQSNLPPVENNEQVTPTVTSNDNELMAQAIVHQTTQNYNANAGVQTNVNSDPMHTMPTNMEPKMGTILVVEDSNIVANFVKKIFDAKYDVVIAGDGAKAIELVDEPNFRSSIKACLLDLNMPNVDGYAVLEHFKQNNYFVKLPVAVVSGVEDMGSLDKVRAYPIVDILSKPFNERDVQTVLEKCLATYF